MLLAKRKEVDFPSMQIGFPSMQINVLFNDVSERYLSKAYLRSNGNSTCFVAITINVTLGRFSSEASCSAIARIH